MLNNELKRNGSGYYDGTPYNAVLCNPESGDVYDTAMNKTYLILKNHGKFSIALSLFPSVSPSNTTHEIIIDETVVSRSYYTNPAMIQYVFNDIFKNRIGTLKQGIFTALMEKVGDNLGVVIKVSKEPTEDQERIIANMKKELQRAHEADIASFKDAELYKRMYYELLDRLIAKG